MKPAELLSAQLIDILFSDRNKLYGAYELRKTYSRRINTALFITLFVAAAAFGAAALANGSKKKISTIIPYDGYMLTAIDEKKMVEPKPEPQPKPEPKPVKTIVFNDPKIKPDDQVNNPLPDIIAVDSSLLGNKKLEGEKYGREVEFPKEPGPGTGIVDPPKKDPIDEVLTHVEVEAKFIGDWVKFLLKNLRADVPIENNAGPGRYSVIIQFVVDKEGNVSDINALTHHGYGMEEEAIRVIKKAPRWEPAIQNGYKVKAYRRQVIVFIVNEE